MIDLVINSFRESADVKLAFVEMYAERLLEVGKIIANALKEGNKVLLFGNGGSAADAQHIAQRSWEGSRRKGEPCPP
jgi:phosphoheptose isomerase (EC 5.3.1.-)